MEQEAKETREQAFVRLAQKRISKTIDQIRLIGNLAKYPHTPEQTKKMIGALRAAVEEVEYQFGGDKGNHKKGFSFDEEDEE